MHDSVSSTDVVPNHQQESDIVNTRGWIKLRFIMLLLFMLCRFSLLNIFGSISFAIIAMAAPLPEAANVNTSSSYGCLDVQENDTDDNSPIGTLQWSQEERTMVVNAIEWGILVAVLPMGRLSELVNPKLLMTTSILATSVLSALIPVVAVWSLHVLIAIQVLLGVGNALSMIVGVRLISMWFPKQELNTMVAIDSFVGTLSSVISPLYMTGLIHSDFLGGWPSIFYINAVASTIFLIIWQFLASSDPERHKRITGAEKDYIIHNRLDISKKKMSLPWKEMLKSMPIWSMVAAGFTSDSGMMLMNYQLPSYMAFPLGVSIKQVAHFLAAVRVASAVLVIISGFLTDSLLQRCFHKENVLRKALILLSGFALSISMALIPLSGCSVLLVLVFVLVATAFRTVSYITLKTTTMKMAPNFAGTIYALQELAITSNSPLITVIVSVTTGKETSLQTWSKVFYIFAGTSLVGPVMFLFFGSSELQPWAKEYPDEQAEKELKAPVENEETSQM